MDKLIEQMLKKYSSETVEDRKNSVKEVIQEHRLMRIVARRFFRFSRVLWRNGVKNFLRT